MEDFLYRFLSLFYHLPQPIKRIFGKMYSWLPRKIKYGSFYYTYQKRLNYFNHLNSYEETSRKHQQLLFTQIHTAIDTIPFYRNYKKVNSLEEFREYPIIDKNTISESFPEFINSKLKHKKIATNTGGSSGTPMEFYIEKNVARPKEKAHFDWYWGLFDYRPNNRILMIRGLPLPHNSSYEYSSISNTLNVSCYNINEHNILPVLQQINKFKPLFIHAYPSSLKIITSLLEKHKETIDFSVRAIFLGSEHLIEADRGYFELFYNAKVVNWYGHSERLIHGGNCPVSDEFHFYPSYGYLELLDTENRNITEPGKEGRIVATGFDNRVMPFIRYDTGDLGVLSGNRECVCGFKGNSLQRITGRGQDYIMLSDNTKVTLTAFIFGQHLEAFRRIREMQIVQHSVGEIEMKIVKNDNFTENDEISLVKTLIDSVNNKIKIRIRYEDTLPKTSRGKSRFFISKLIL